MVSKKMMQRVGRIKDTDLNKLNWSPESGYLDKFGAKEYPNRTVDAGEMDSFKLSYIFFEPDLQYWCKRNEHEIKIALTMPGEEVRMSRNFFTIQTLEHIQIKITPKLTNTSEGLRNYTPKQRQCFYSYERQLRFYKMYMQSSCEVECLTNFTKIECGCVKFSMPSMQVVMYSQLSNFILLLFQEITIQRFVVHQRLSAIEWLKKGWKQVLKHFVTSAIVYLLAYTLNMTQKSIELVLIVSL